MHLTVLCRARILVLMALGAGASGGCQSMQMAMFDDDCTSTRLTFWESDPEYTLPSPREASEEALLWMQERDTQLLAAKGSALDGVDSSMAAASEEMDWDMSQVHVFVPELLQREYFVRTSSLETKNSGRRKPLFAKAKFGTNSENIDTLSFMKPEVLRARTGLPSLGAMSSYEVEAGDSLGSISKKIYGTTDRWMELAHLNNLGNGSLIFPKEILFYVKDPQVLGKR